MTFREAVGRTASIRNAFRDGLKALKGSERKYVRAGKARLAGSVDLDSTLAPVHPNDPRWDYGIGLRSSRRESVVWIEVHADSSDIGGVLRKLTWLKNWLAAEAPQLRQMSSRFEWIAPGGSGFRKGSRQERRIAQAGLAMRTRPLDLDAIP